MAHATAEAPVDRGQLVRPTVQALPVTPGKVAMWLFLATEVMFFTGLIGSYIVLRAGSPSNAYSNLFAPATKLQGLEDTKGVHIRKAGSNPKKVAELLQPHYAQMTEAQVEELAESGHALTPGLPAAQAERLGAALKAAGATVGIEPLRTYSWPQPYDHETNPLSIDLTALNTFFLICSSVTMVLALAAIQRGDKARLSLFLLATILIGSVFVGIQFVEYRKLLSLDAMPVGISDSGHFNPAASLFASCFFAMTGFHGAHVTAGVLMLIGIWIQSLRGRYTHDRHSPVELVGLYWHFVDLVWILLFTVVYLI